MITPISEFGAYPFSIDRSNHNIDGILDLLAQDEYQRVLQNRPLLYVLWNDRDVEKYFDASLKNVADALERFREGAARRQMPDPYIVIMGGAPDVSATLAHTIKADAISNYISSFSKIGAQPFSELEPQVESFWRKLVTTGVASIPIAMIGWDTRPRLEQPVPWQHSDPVANPSDQKYYVDANPEEFARHIQRAVDFVRLHPRECPAKSILIYSWDECDEGGCILPTLGDPRGVYLRALRSVR
ncbi:hypothetical protein XH98_37285 [Bradyrhizobium sp. CCBAU 51745]|nr:hypothetical protein [Bradyrhizobium sp. CCBAU 51745]